MLPAFSLDKKVQRRVCAGQAVRKSISGHPEISPSNCLMSNTDKLTFAENHLGNGVPFLNCRHVLQHRACTGFFFWSSQLLF
ncbi:hypothetical protein CLOSTMETH_01140 [[Clostridium] methylpentosum DSM 5476]|uniref:Uncharacterized protein n=1 Tax=[Clostridium] methylpentosum DSM 5476 TaxID=537013 RepID=C0EBC2_9FIRM|nr:hypothetical protein CLOSTMETH_01140 [[Clostridium] methylpentosum DSM 5476]